MHQSIGTTAPYGPGNGPVWLGNSGVFDFALCKGTVLQGHFMVKVLPTALHKSWQENMTILWLVWAWNQYPHSSVTALPGQCGAQNMASPTVSPLSQAPWGPVLHQTLIFSLDCIRTLEIAQVFSSDRSRDTNWIVTEFNSTKLNRESLT